MNVLVLGGTRFMGRHLVRALLAGGYDVTIATRGRTPDDFGDTVKRKIIDHGNGESMKPALSGVTYDVVFDNLAFASNDVKRALDAVRCDKYIMISSTAVYDKHMDTREEQFDPLHKPLIWCNRRDFAYDESKRLAECALAQIYGNVPSVAVRFPFIIGPDDYIKRLHFYVEHIVRRKPMHIDNFSNQMAFVRSDEAGKFLAFLAGTNFCGVINGASEQTVSMEEIAAYVTRKTGCVPVLSASGDEAPYNGEPAYSINVDKAKDIGFLFSPLKDWIFELVDKLIAAY